MFPTDTLDWRAGVIARTTYAGIGAVGHTGSKVINSAQPHFIVNSAVNWPIRGEVLHKVGVATGWTFGEVYETCADVPLLGFPSLRIVCTDKANLLARGGDSGAPVFVPNFTTGTAAFYGIVVSAQGSTGVVFSNVNQIRQDLGMVTFF